MTEDSLLKSAAALCARRECCRADFEKKWRAKAVPEHEIETLLQQLEREGFIDENRYAKAFVNDKLRYDRWGRLKIRAALMAKGISSGDIQEALATIDEEAYLAALRHVLDAKRRTLNADSDFSQRRKLAAFAASRGFESHLVFKLLDWEDDADF